MISGPNGATSGTTNFSAKRFSEHNIDLKAMLSDKLRGNDNRQPEKPMMRTVLERKVFPDLDASPLGKNYKDLTLTMSFENDEKKKEAELANKNRRISKPI